MALPSKFALYEAAVQSPRWQVDALPQFHKAWLGKAPLSFREDFCGTARVAQEWVRSNPRRTAVGIDLDPEVLEYAETQHLPRLPPAQRRRLTLRKQDVLGTQKRSKAETFDWIGAFNYSVFEFHDRKTLLRYAKNALKALNTKGTLFLEIAGGPRFISCLTEEKTVTIPGVGRVRQIWEQHIYDPITAVSDYAIHFKLPNGQWLNDAFTYHWRLWGIRELREVLLEAGFHDTQVLWEKTNSKGEGTGEFEATDAGEPYESWVAYVVGIKCP